MTEGFVQWLTNIMHNCFISLTQSLTPLDRL
jgi:hypothetical protein